MLGHPFSINLFFRYCKFKRNLVSNMTKVLNKSTKKVKLYWCGQSAGKFTNHFIVFRNCNVICITPQRLHAEHPSWFYLLLDDDIV